MQGGEHRADDAFHAAHKSNSRCAVPRGRVARERLDCLRSKDRGDSVSAYHVVPIKQSERDMWWTLYSGGVPIRGIATRFERGNSTVQAEIKRRRDAAGIPVIRHNVTAPELRGRFLDDFGKRPHLAS